MPQYRVGGAFFHASTVHAIPQRETDADRCTFNRRSAKPARRSPANRESPSLSHSSSKRLPSQRFRQRQPRSSGVLLHPRHFNGPTLRMAIAKCRQPGSTHHLNELTGKSGRYVYDSCAGRANTATTICALIRIPIATLDDIVLDAVEEQVLERQRFKCLLTEILGLTTAEIERGKRGLTLTSVGANSHRKNDRQLPQSSRIQPRRIRPPPSFRADGRASASPGQPENRHHEQ